MNIFNIDFSELLFRVKLGSSILSFLFAGSAVFFIVQFRKLVDVKSQLTRGALRTKNAAFGGAVQSKWEEILEHMNSNREAEWKFAIIEADKFVDDLLKTAGYPGDSMGERLTNID